MPLTDIQIRNTELKQKAYKLTDGEGLYLFVNKSGKYFRFDYRFRGKRKTLSLGVYPKLSLRKARKKLHDAKELLANGIDPGLRKKEKKIAERQTGVENFEQLAREWFGKKSGTWVERYSRTVMQRLELNVFPYIGHLRIDEITPPTLLSVLRRMENRGVHDTARRVRQICSKIFQYGIAVGLAERDPAADLKGALTAVKTNNMATIKEPRRIGELMRAIDGYFGSYITQCALKLAPLLFVRPGELRHMQWSEVDLDRALWRIPGEKMKMRGDHLVPLSSQAISILKDIAQLTHELSGPGYVFPSIRSNSRPMSENTINAALRRLGYTKEEMTGHGFRAMASTNLNEQGWRSEVIERQLAHAERNSVKAAYNHAEYLPERKKMMQHWSDYLDGLKTSSNIVSINRVA